MSIAVMSRLFKAQLGSPSRKMLAIRLADFADDVGRGSGLLLDGLHSKQNFPNEPCSVFCATSSMKGCWLSWPRAADDRDRPRGTISICGHWTICGGKTCRRRVSWCHGCHGVTRDNANTDG